MAGGVGRAAIHLAGILAAEGAAAVGAVAAVGIHNDLAPGQAAVARRPAQHKAAGGVDVIAGVLVQQPRRDHLIDHFLAHGVGDLLLADGFVMLGGDHHRVHGHGHAVLIGDGHLRLAVRTHPGQGAVLAHLGHAAGQPLGQGQRHGGHFLGFIAGKAKHHALVARALLMIGSGGNALGDIGALAMHGGDDGAGIRVKAQRGIVIADIADHLAGDLFHVALAVCRDFTHDHHQTRGGAALARHAGGGILAQHFVQDGVGDLVAHLVGMSFGHAFRGKELSHSVCPFCIHAQKKTAGPCRQAV